ncbi:epoxide hydrolase family protein [Streptomyces bobili]|uniref:epoxide hydrolase family protein n=1 Tax=Streptomyces bobili TaxID=67280 RepID=UPI00382146DD
MSHSSLDSGHSTGPDAVRPWRIAYPQTDLDDLRERLRKTRWPEPATVPGWTQGVPLEYLRELCAYWAEEYDWRAAERRINRLPQYRTDIDGVGIHFVHARSPHPDAMPLILTHGWPGSFLEFEEVIGPLTNPTAHGGQAADAFHVVVPSLPGFGFSGRPAEQGWDTERIAAAWAELMARLGYERYGAQGGDWGSMVTTALAEQHGARVAGIHLSAPPVGPDPGTLDELTEPEKAALATMEVFQRSGSGYSAMMSTRPQTVGYALLDSPVGLCAWIVEKLQAWSDCDGVPENALTRDRILDTVTLYWLTATAASSARLYWEGFPDAAEQSGWRAPQPVATPTGGTVFPADMLRPSRRWAERRYPNLRYWSEPDRGGHFPAAEQPDLFTAELRAFFDLIR